jgi:hypothetical protein
LNEISARAPSYENAPFDPTIYPEFVAVVTATERGVIDLWYEDIEHGVSGRMMKVCWRWIPADQTLSNRFLTVVAVSKYSIKTATLNWAWGGVTAIIGFTGAVIFMCLWFLTGKSNKKNGGQTNDEIN